MKFAENQSYHDYTDDGYPELRYCHADVILLGRWDGLSNALYSLREDGILWAQYNSEDALVETYTILNGVVEMECRGKRRILEIGETIDVSQYEQIISFYGKTNVDILIKMDAKSYEPRFFETQLLLIEADAIEAVDDYTYMHCNRIKDYSIEVWKHLGLPKESLRTLRWGAYFHDIGKRVVPVDILNKPEKLTSEEWEIMKTHTTEGAEIIRNHPILWLKDVAFIVEQHHERFDGKGYPYGLKNDEIALESSIVSVVDAFDAMTTDRVYKKALTIQVAVKELENGKGTQFNPIVVEAFLEILEKNQFNWK
ncbi:HD-GYP domain-containing protein [Sporosarcina limicola]|uniref:Nucleotidyltransferase with HDIG domain n=1 Tax=Sporosarcina limicola TaxID=34101 RepID=A0A927MK02_9BACL|nr:HD-GYP domain-containing protein [Sporosarcina limicola]MBE1552984.1 putative nucleotidyltransferase with HDIG domain [Sporosarcina limicola]